MRFMGLVVALLAGTAHAQLAGSAASRADGLAPAQADNAMLFVVSNRVTPRQSACTVRVQADWQPDARQFAVAGFDVLADADAGTFSGPERLLSGPGTKDGDVAPDGGSVTGILSGQLCFPLDPPCGDFPCPNPQPLWQATWSTTDFTPRIVNLSTVTSRFDVYLDKEGCLSKSYHGVLIEGAGQIVVTCYADCDQSTGLGVLDLFDFLCYVNEFNAGSPDADCDGNGGLDLFDFLCFVNEFNAGC